MLLQLVKYGLVGIVSTLIHIGVASLYIYLIHQNIFIANIIGFCVAFAFSYTVQSLYVFKHSLGIVKFSKYFLVQFGALIAALIASILLPMENLYIKTVMISILLPLITFVLHKIWTFKDIEEECNYARK